MRERGKGMLKKIPRDALLVLIMVLTATASFGLGVAAGREEGKGVFSIEETPLVPALPASAGSAESVSVLPTAIPAGGQVVASKNGTRYYFPWCGGAKQIKEANKVWFASKEEAEKAGYTPAANCAGL